MAESKTIRQLEERLAEAEPGSLRHATLEAAKRFKSSWIELGRQLWTVWKEKAYRPWGYLTFEAYCGKELQIRSATAKKLLHSYFFLEKEEPAALKRLTSEAPAAALPSAEAVNVLRLLKSRQGIPEGEYQRVRTYVLEDGRDLPLVQKEVRQILEESRPDSQEAQAQRRRAAIRRTVGTLKALRRELAEGNSIPKKLLGELDQLVRKLEEVL